MNSISRIAAVAAGLTFAGTAVAQQKEVMIGAQCDRTGPTQIVGVAICPAQQDYIDLVALTVTGSNTMSSTMNTKCRRP